MLPENFPILSNSTNSGIHQSSRCLIVPFLVHNHYSSFVQSESLTFPTKTSSAAVHEFNTQRTQRPQVSAPKYHKHRETSSYSRHIRSTRYCTTRISVQDEPWNQSMSLPIVDLAQHPIRPPTSKFTNSMYCCVPYQPTNDHRFQNTSCINLINSLYLWWSSNISRLVMGRR